jgi:hypothetical protein
MMSISNESNEGTSNAERIATEIELAAQAMMERFSGYPSKLAKAAMECYLLTAEHDEQRININQRYDQVIRSLSGEVSENTAGGAER